MSAAVAGHELPRDEVRVVLQLRDDDLVALREGPPDGLRDEAETVGGAAGEDDLLAARGADEALDRVARQLVELGRLLAQGVDRAVDVGVAPLVVAVHRLDHGAGLLARCARVEVDERMAVDDPLQDREIRARLLVESHARLVPLSAWPSTESGRVTQRIRVGRISRLEHVEHVGNARGPRRPPATRPATRSATTSADAVQMAHESPTNPAASMRPSGATVSIMRTRSPQSGFTSSATALAPGSLAAMPRLAPPLADDVAVDAVRGRSAHSSSPRAAFVLYGGKR